VSIKDEDKDQVLDSVRKLEASGFTIIATDGTANYLQDKGVKVEFVNKVKEGRPHCVDALKNNEIAMVFNTTFGAQSVTDSYSIRRTALMHSVAYFTTVAGMHAAVDGILAMQREGLDVETIQGYYLR
jgi:carbamoyl-phosphate synthase large subunit